MPDLSFTFTPTAAEKLLLFACGCTVCTEGCPNCTVTPYTMKVTIAGASLPTWNREYLVVRDYPTTLCVWVEAVNLECDIKSASLAIISPTLMSFNLADSGNVSRASWVLAGAVDCLGVNTLAFNTILPACGTAPATITAEPA